MNGFHDCSYVFVGTKLALDASLVACHLKVLFHLTPRDAFPALRRTRDRQKAAIVCLVAVILAPTKVSLQVSDSSCPLAPVRFHRAVNLKRSNDVGQSFVFPTQLLAEALALTPPIHAAVFRGDEAVHALLAVTGATATHVTRVSHQMLAHRTPALFRDGGKEGENDNSHPLNRRLVLQRHADSLRL